MRKGTEPGSGRLFPGRTGLVGMAFIGALIFLLPVLMTLAPVAHAGSSYTASTSGDWSSPATWGGTAPPMTLSSSDFITILPGVTVTIASMDTVTNNGAAGFIIESGGTLAVAGTLVGATGFISNAGTLSLSGTVTLDAGSSFYDYAGAINVLNGGTLSNGGSIILELPTPLLFYPTVTVSGGGTLDNAGYIHVPSGGANLATITNEGTLNNNAGGDVDVQGRLYNYGTFNSAPGATVGVGDYLENDGQFNNAGGFGLEGGVNSPGNFVNSGTLSIYGTAIFDSTGPFTNADGGTVGVLATLSVGPGPISNQDGATINVYGTLENDGGAIANNGAVVIGGGLASVFDNYGSLANNADGTLTVNGGGAYVGGALTNNGQIINHGSFDTGGLENYATITNEYGGQLTLTPTLDYLINNAGASVTNDYGGTIIVGVAAGLQNLGTVDNYGLISSTGSGSFLSESSNFYNHCPTGSVTATIDPDTGVPYNEGCTLTFQQSSLPSGQEWGVTVYTLEAATNGGTGTLVWLTTGSAQYTGTGSSIQVPNVSGQAFTYSIDSPINDPPDITFDCADTLLLPFTGTYYGCSGTSTAILTGPATVLGVYYEYYHIPTTTTIAPGSASVYASDPNGVTFTILVADSNTGVQYAPNGGVSLSDGGAGGTFGDPYGDGPGSYSPYCLYEVNTYTSQCQFTYYPNPVGSSTTTVTITATFGGDYYHLGSSATASVTVTYYVACPQVPNKGGANLKGANLQDCELAGYNLSGDNLMGANIGSADLTGANLQGANLKGAILTSDVLDGASFQGSNLVGADLASSSGSGVIFRLANLQGADLQGMTCTSCDFSGANLQGANLSGGAFQYGDFTGSNLQASNMSYGDFSYANFTGANTNKANIIGANFTGAMNPP